MKRSVIKFHPKKGDFYWHIGDGGEIYGRHWDGDYTDIWKLCTGNAFFVRQYGDNEAQKMAGMYRLYLIWYGEMITAKPSEKKKICAQIDETYRSDGLPGIEEIVDIFRM